MTKNEVGQTQQIGTEGDKKVPLADRAGVEAERRDATVDGLKDQSQTIPLMLKPESPTSDLVAAQSPLPASAPPEELKMSLAGSAESDAAKSASVSADKAPEFGSGGYKSESGAVLKTGVESSINLNKEVTNGTITKSLADTQKVKTTNLVAATELKATQPAAPVATTPTVMPPPMPSRLTAKSAKRAPEPSLAKIEVPSATNVMRGLQSGWLDLATKVFYVEFGRTSTGAFVRGHLDERNKFQVTSTTVEGQVIEFNAQQATSRGTYGWFELSSRDFVPSRPGLKPSYPYIEGYQDKQGEFHPISRQIYKAGD